MGLREGEGEGEGRGGRVRGLIGSTATFVGSAHNERDTFVGSAHNERDMVQWREFHELVLGVTCVQHAAAL